MIEYFLAYAIQRNGSREIQAQSKCRDLVRNQGKLQERIEDTKETKVAIHMLLNSTGNIESLIEAPENT